MTHGKLAQSRKSLAFFSCARRKTDNHRRPADLDWTAGMRKQTAGFLVFRHVRACADIAARTSSRPDCHEASRTPKVRSNFSFESTEFCGLLAGVG